MSAISEVDFEVLAREWEPKLRAMHWYCRLVLVCDWLHKLEDAVAVRDYYTEDFFIGLLFALDFKLLPPATALLIDIATQRGYARRSPFHPLAADFYKQLERLADEARP